MTMKSGGIYGNPGVLFRPGDIFNRQAMKNYTPLATLTPGVDGTQIGMPASIMQAAQDAPAQAPKKGGGAFWKILGALGDGLAVAGGAKPVYMPMMLDLQQRNDEERKWQTELAQRAELAREQANRPTDAIRTFQAYQQMDPQTRALYDQSKRGDPAVTLTLPGDRGIYSGPQSGLADALRGYAVSEGAAPSGSELPAGYSIRGQGGSPQPAPTGPTMTRLQYRDIQKLKGVEGAAKWVLANGIQVVGN